MTKEIKANLIDIKAKKIYPACIKIENGNIADIQSIDESVGSYILPGFVDAHVHVESSMLTPAEFARLAVVHGTVATISDPHEIGNVLGVKGVEYMIENGKQTPFKFYFGAPSCVPASRFETAGAVIDKKDIEYLLNKEEVIYLAEMMNFPAVLQRLPEVMDKIAIAQKLNKPIDGHAPGLKGEQAKSYIEAGISTDHECFTLEEALDKLRYGMKIIIREGSAAKNFEALESLISSHTDHIMFCSDDKHPDNLVEGHINLLVKRALAKGHDLFDVLQVACVNPVKHYRMAVGLLEKGTPADFIVVENLENWQVQATYINGEKVAENNKSLIQSVPTATPNHFNTNPKKASDFVVEAKGKKIKVIEPTDGQLITQTFLAEAKIKDNCVVSDTSRDILKIVVVNRYQDAPPAVGFIKNFGLKEGALASCVAHDSHNIVAVGVNDEAITQVVNMIIEAKGGVAAISNTEKKILALPIAGIMSDKNGYEVAQAYSEIDAFSKKLGCSLHSPFMTLSFMALLVIPSLKLSDLGLFDGNKFELTSLFENS